MFNIKKRIEKLVLKRKPLPEKFILLSKCILKKSASEVISVCRKISDFFKKVVAKIENAIKAVFDLFRRLIIMTFETLLKVIENILSKEVLGEVVEALFVLTLIVVMVSLNIPLI